MMPDIAQYGTACQRAYEYAGYEPKGLYTHAPCPKELLASKLKSESSHAPAQHEDRRLMSPKSVIKLP